jgi:hypothetical protein
MDGIRAEVNFIRITETAACTMGLRGSPTILVNGADPFPRPEGTGT